MNAHEQTLCNILTCVCIEGGIVDGTNAIAYKGGQVTTPLQIAAATAKYRNDLSAFLAYIMRNEAHCLDLLNQRRLQFTGYRVGVRLAAAGDFPPEHQASFRKAIFAFAQDPQLPAEERYNPSNSSSYWAVIMGRNGDLVVVNEPRLDRKVHNQWIPPRG